MGPPCKGHPSGSHNCPTIALPGMLATLSGAGWPGSTVGAPFWAFLVPGRNLHAEAGSETTRLGFRVLSLVSALISALTSPIKDPNIIPYNKNPFKEFGLWLIGF